MCPWQNWLSVFTDHYSMSLFHNFWSSRILSEVWVVIWFVNRKCFCCPKHPYFDVEWRLCSHQRAEGMCRARGRKSEPHDDDPGWLSRRVACQKSPSLRYVPRCSPRTPATITVCTCEGACFPPCVLHVSYVPTFHSVCWPHPVAKPMLAELLVLSSFLMALHVLAIAKIYRF